MKLHYFRHPEGNFGDDLNPWLWPRLAPDLLTESGSDSLFLGIGTILNRDVPQVPAKIVLGSGAGYGPPPSLDGTWRFYAVRGPLTARALKLPESLVATDAAMLLRFVPMPEPRGTCPLGFMPHVSVAEPWRELCAQTGVRFLDPREPVERLLDAMLECRVVASEAMHGAIVADTLRIPWIAVKSYRHTNTFKWRDWCRSLGLSYRPVFVGPVWPAELDADFARRVELRTRAMVARTGLRTLLRRGRPVLSPTDRFLAATDGLMERLQALRGDRAAGKLAQLTSARA